MAGLVRGLLFCAIGQGLEPLELLERAGLTLAELGSFDTPVLYTKALALVREIHARRPDFHLGLRIGMDFSTARMEALGYALTRAPTFGRALRDFLRFQRALNGGLVVWNLQLTPAAF